MSNFGITGIAGSSHAQGGQVEGGAVTTIYADGAILSGTGSLLATGYLKRLGVEWLVLASMELDSGTRYYSDGTVTHPTRTYVGRVLRWGSIDRSIPQPAGLPQTGDAQVRIADTDRQLRDILVVTTARRRVMSLKFVQMESSEAAAAPFFTGEIVDFSAGPGYIDITLRDKTFSWLDLPIPNIPMRDNFPFTPAPPWATHRLSDEAFIPIIAGSCHAPSDGIPGVIRLPHIGWSAANGDVFAVAQHPIYSVIIYRREPGGEYFVVVPGAQYLISEQVKTIDGISYTFTFCSFYSQQTDGVEIRADVEGLEARGGWNGYPAVTGTPLRNPIDFFINMTAHVLAVAGVEADFDAGRIMAVRQRFEELLYTCDGAITTQMTCREFLARFLSSFNLDMFVTKEGKIALNFTEQSDSSRPTFTEGRHILLNSFVEWQSNPSVNQVRYRFDVNYATNEWASTELYDEAQDQTALGEVESEQLDQWFIRDPSMAEDVARRRLDFLRLTSYRQEFKLPTPEVFDQLELGRQISITHHDGMSIGGYNGQEVKVLGISHAMDRFETTVRTIRSPWVIFSDNFNRTSGLGANYGDPLPADVDTAWIFISGNELHLKANGFTNNLRDARILPVSYAAGGFYVQLTYRAISFDQGEHGVWIKTTSPANYYKIGVQKLGSSALVVAPTGGILANVDDVYKLSLNAAGTLLTWYRNGTIISTAVPSGGPPYTIGLQAKSVHPTGSLLVEFDDLVVGYL